MRHAVARLEGMLASLTARAWHFFRVRAAANAEDLAKARFGGALVLLPLLGLFSAALLLSENVLISAYVVDYTLPLETGLRWLHGHVPHIDYHTPIGAAYWLFQGLAVELIGLDVRSPIVANFIAAAVLAVCGLPLLKSRLAAGFAGLVLFTAVMVVISPRSLGDPPGQVSFLAAYNKVAIAALLLLLTTLFVERRRPAGPPVLACEAILAGALLVLLVYLKVTFAAVAIAGAIVSLYYAPGNRRLAVLAMAIAAAVSVAIGAWLGIAGGYLADISQTSASVGLLRPGKALDDLIAGVPLLTVVALSLIAYWRHSRTAGPDRVSNVVLVTGLMTASLLAMNQVHDNAWPLAVAVLIILAARALRGGERAHVGPTVGALALVCYMVFADTISTLFFVTAQRDGTALAYCEDPERPICGLKVAVFSPHILARLRPLQMPPEEPLAPPRTMAALHLECDSDNHCIWWKMQEDLLRHLDRHIRPQDRPFLLGFMNILPYHFGLEPPLGVPAWLDVGRNLSLEAHPEPRAMLADATLVVVPHMKEEIGYFPELMAIYGETIRSSFTVVEQNPLWSIWRRD